jgi:membrane protein implicated in regulation of membrane protease activity
MLDMLKSLLSGLVDLLIFLVRVLIDLVVFFFKAALGLLSWLGKALWYLVTEVWEVWSNLLFNHTGAAAITIIVAVVVYLVWKGWNRWRESPSRSLWTKPEVIVGIATPIISALLGLVLPSPQKPVQKDIDIRIEETKGGQINIHSGSGNINIDSKDINKTEKVSSNKVDADDSK